MTYYLIECCHVIHLAYSLLDDGGALIGVCVIVLHRLHFTGE